MSKITDEYCDVCGQLLYHSVHSYTLPAKERWWWHGFPERNSDIEICGDCHWAVKYLVAERKDLVKATMARLKDKTYQEQMEQKPKALTNRMIAKIFRGNL